MAETLAELLKRLGNVPLHRVWVRPPIGTAKERDVVKAYSGVNRRLCELVENTLVKIAYDLRASALGGALLAQLWRFLQGHKLGVVLPATAMVRLKADLVRIPCVSFYRWSQFPHRRVPDEAISSVVPELVAEVWRPDNTEAELERKRREYFEAGVRTMWIIHSRKRWAEVYSDVERCTRVGRNGSLSGDDVLPGFTLSLRELFSCLAPLRVENVSE